VGKMQKRDEIKRIKKLLRKTTLCSLFSSLSNKFIKKCLNRILSSLRRIQRQVTGFFTYLSMDPEFIERDTAFTTSPTGENYNNFVAFIAAKEKVLKKITGIKESHILCTDDNNVPFFSLKNSYNKYIEGKITFPRKENYISLIKASLNGNDVLSGPFGLIISQHVGVNMSYASAFLGLLLIGIASFFTIAKSLKGSGDIIRSGSPEAKEILTTSEFAIVIFFIIVGIILVLYALNVFTESSDSSS
jgi:hypothetical protein